MLPLVGGISRKSPSSSTGSTHACGDDPRVDTPVTFKLASHRLLVICAHPDDESFGLGAVIAAFVTAGTTARLLCFTRGEASTLGAAPELSTRRSGELSAAADALGISEVRLLDHPDSGLADVPTPSLAGEIDRMLGDADLILTFDSGGITGHPDHQAATRAAIAAGRRHGIAVLGWAIPDDVAAQLNREVPAAFVGTPPDRSDLVLAVDRATQHTAMAHHASQLASNPVPLRRLELQGDLEHLNFLHRPAGTERPTVHAGPDAIDTAVDNARAGHPAEICGLIGGSDRRLDQAVAVENIATPPPGRCGFHMDPTGQLRATRAFEDHGLDITGVYHSHPSTPPVPSAQDIRLAADPDATHLIISIKTTPAAMAAWRVDGDLAEQAHILID